MRQKRPRIMIAGTNSGCGKTTIMCGILSALKLEGIKAATCKCGPDYIDPMFHSQVFNIPSENLDLFFSTEQQVNFLLEKNGRGAEVSLLEGVMGFYDGMGMDSTKASSYDLAKVTNTPVILVLNCKGMALSVIPILKGFLEFRRDHTIKGVILNGVSKMTGKMLAEVIERELPIKVYGCVPKLDEFHLQSRHLGLITPLEMGEIQSDMKKLGEKFLEYIDFNKLLELAHTAKDIDDEMPEEWKIAFSKHKFEKIRIGIAYDRAFCFYYKENLELLEQFGCELVYFSPLEDSKLPEGIDALLLGGGYPELYSKELSKNTSMLIDIKEKLESGLPCIAECGGFMYLHEELEDEHGVDYKMVGVISGKAFNQKRLVRFGYISLVENQTNTYLMSEESIKGHEFHYWDSDNNGETFLAKKPSGKRSWICMHGTKNLLAGFPHLYYFSNLNVIVRFLSKCKRRN